MRPLDNVIANGTIQSKTDSKVRGSRGMPPYCKEIFQKLCSYSMVVDHIKLKFINWQAVQHLIYHCLLLLVLYVQTVIYLATLQHYNLFTLICCLSLLWSHYYLLSYTHAVEVLDALNISINLANVAAFCLGS